MKCLSLFSGIGAFEKALKNIGIDIELVGFSDEDFNKAQGAGVSDTQLYKQAGNSIVVNVLEAVFKEMRW